MRFYISIVFLVIVTACAPGNDPGIQVEVAVASTLAAIPTPTSPPISTPLPPPTPFDLKGLFCEYQFCVGHPIDMAFFDVSAQQNAASPSTYSQGLIAAYNANLFIQMLWQIAPGAADPEFALDLILDERLDTRLGSPDVKRVREMNAIYSPITSTASPLLPYGGAAAWTCGDRVFAWKAYTPDESSPTLLFENALTRFICSR
jgi:hypothetical protein